MTTHAGNPTDEKLSYDDLDALVDDMQEDLDDLYKIIDKQAETISQLLKQIVYLAMLADKDK